MAPFFLNETFPDNWYRRGVPLALPVAFEQAAEMFLANPRALGGNQGVGNFVPLDLSTDLSTASPAQIGCFILENLLDVAPGQLDPTIYNNFKLYTGFIKGKADALYDLVRGILTNSIQASLPPSSSMTATSTVRQHFRSQSHQIALAQLMGA